MKKKKKKRLEDDISKSLWDDDFGLAIKVSNVFLPI
jgi:hypothetical protein